MPSHGVYSYWIQGREVVLTAALTMFMESQFIHCSHVFLGMLIITSHHIIVAFGRPSTMLGRYLAQVLDRIPSITGKSM